jgi:RNA methyltransferase, TrmH family
LATIAGPHAQRVARARELLTVKGRKEHGRFAFEGPTLLEEALRSGVVLEELFVARHVYEKTPVVREIEASGTPVYLVDDRTAAKLSDVETPTGVIAIAQARLHPLAEILAKSMTLVLADLNDPGNVGTLLRSAEAFGATGVVLGKLGVDPYHPKVVRGAMGSIFRLPVTVATPREFAAAAGSVSVVGLAAGGVDIAGVSATMPMALIVGHERRGLGDWAAACQVFAGIPMGGPAESLNAGVAGSVALYALSRTCQDSVGGSKSQDFTT